MKTLLLFLLLVICPMVVQAQSDTCTDGQSLVIDTVNKRYKCITISGGSLGAGGNVNMTVANASSTGTTVNRLAKLTGAPSTAVIAATSDTENAVGVVTAGAGTTGSATIAIMGQVSCDFDGATTAGNYVIISVTTAGKCHDGGSSFPTAGAAYGRVLTTNGAQGTYAMELMTPDLAFQNAGNGKSKPGGSDTDFQWNNSNVFAGGGPLKRTSSTQISLSNAGDSFAFGGGALLTGTSLELALTSANFKTGNVFSGSTFYLGGNAGTANGGLQFSNSNQLMWASGNVTGGGQTIEVAMGRDVTGLAEITDGILTQLGSDADLRDLKVRHYFTGTRSTTTNCLDSAGAAACGVASAGSVVIDASATTVVVSTTSVTANSQIFVQYDSSLSTRLSVTCNATVAIPAVTARTAGTSFTITVPVAPVSNPACYSFFIVN